MLIISSQSKETIGFENAYMVGLWQGFKLRNFMANAKGLNRFRIGQLAQEVGVEQFVIRFWEKEFNLTCKRSQGGQRFYTISDVERFKKIRELLYEKKFTIEGARSVLSGKTTETIIVPSIRIIEKDDRKELIEQLQILKKQLIKLRSLL